MKHHKFYPAILVLSKRCIMSIKLPNVLNTLTSTELKSLISHPQIKSPQILFYNSEVINTYIFISTTILRNYKETHTVV